MSDQVLCTVATQEGKSPGYDSDEEVLQNPGGIRTLIINSYDIGKYFYGIDKRGAVKKLDMLGSLIWYWLIIRKGRTGGGKGRFRVPVDVDLLVERWKTVVVGLSTAHDKDAADRYEAAVEECLTPILTCPVKQLREFYPKLVAALKNDPQVPFMVWRAYEIWADTIIGKATDEDIITLKKDLASHITYLVEQDIKDQIPDQLVRALMWRSESTLKEVHEEVVKVKEKGGSVRLRGRESCLFMEVGGTEDEPKVCVQI